MDIGLNSPPSDASRVRSCEIVLVDAISGGPDSPVPHGPPGAITIRLRLDAPGLRQLLEAVERLRPARELHLLCPGRIDQIVLGTTLVTLRALRENHEMRAGFTKLGQLLGGEAALVLGGANVGQQQDGHAFLQTLADLVQREVSVLVRVPPRMHATSLEDIY